MNSKIYLSEADSCMFMQIKWMLYIIIHFQRVINWASVVWKHHCIDINEVLERYAVQFDQRGKEHIEIIYS